MFDIDDVDEAKRMLPIYKRAVDLLETVSGKKTEQAEQEPLAWKHDCAALCANDVELWIDNCPHCGKPRTAAPVRTKDLTDDEIMKINVDTAGIVPTCDRQFHFARAVIAKFKEKNK